MRRLLCLLVLFGATVATATPAQKKNDPVPDPVDPNPPPPPPVGPPNPDIIAPNAGDNIGNGPVTVQFAAMYSEWLWVDIHDVNGNLIWGDVAWVSGPGTHSFWPGNLVPGVEYVVSTGPNPQSTVRVILIKG